MDIKNRIKKFIKKIRNRILNRITFGLHYWGVAYESKKKPEFIVTIHGEERLHERGMLIEKDINRLILRAWHSEQEVPIWWEANKKRLGYHNYSYRLFDGHIYVFKLTRDHKFSQVIKTLITVLNMHPLNT